MYVGMFRDAHFSPEFLGNEKNKQYTFEEKTLSVNKIKANENSDR